MSLAGKVAIVTGSSMGIGEAIAKALLKDGAKVVLADIKEPTWQIPENAIHVKCDVSNSADVQAVIKKAIEKWRRLDIIVNNAGIYPFVPLENMTEAQWDKVMNVNAKSVSLLREQGCSIGIYKGCSLGTCTKGNYGQRNRTRRNSDSGRWSNFYRRTGNESISRNDTSG